jgi:S1-C subfamily serine protease
MNNDRRFWLIAGLGCATVVILVALAGGALFLVLPGAFGRSTQGAQVQPTVSAAPPATLVPGLPATQAAVPTLTPVPSSGSASAAEEAFTPLYQQAEPGVVNIQVYIQQQGVQGQGAGSGFILDNEGHIVTNNHVVADASLITVVFFDGFQAQAQTVGLDPDSDLAVIKVDQLPDNVHPLSLGDSDAVQVGEWVAAIGNPFALGSSLTVGVVSAVGRTIASGATPFSIPQAIQTDAAINPGNSGGPLLNLNGDVIGVNAQIATGGTSNTNSGVGFAIPVNIVRRVAPVLIDTGTYAWPWLGIRGGSVNLFIQEANHLPTERGAYIDSVEGGPAQEVGLRGSTGSQSVLGLDGVPTGGDVITAIDGNPIVDYSDLQIAIAQHEPGDTITLSILRNGQEQQVDVTLQARPAQ